MKHTFIFSFLFLLSTLTLGQKFDQNHLDLLSEEYAKNSFPTLKGLLSIPNDATYASDIEKNVQWCETPFKEGISLQQESIRLLYLYY